MTTRLAQAAGVVLGVGALTYSTCFVVRPGEAAVIYNRISGIQDRVLTEGLQFKVPGVDIPTIFNIRLQPRELTTTTGTKDLQVVDITLRLLYRPQISALPETYRKLGTDFAERVLPSVSNEILKATVAEYQAADLIVHRDQVSERLSKVMRERIREYNIDLEDISLVHIQFGSEFMAAVEQKQVGQQEAERAKFLVLENEQRRQASVIRAEGDAEAAKMISEAINNSGEGLLEIRALEASREVASTLSNSSHVSFVPGGSNILLSTPAKAPVNRR